MKYQCLIAGFSGQEKHLRQYIWPRSVWEPPPPQLRVQHQDKSPLRVEFQEAQQICRICGSLSIIGLDNVAERGAKDVQGYWER
eukprot:2758015-Amphidinium_carterae.1